MCLGVISEGSVLTVHAKETRPSYKIMVNRAANCVTVYEQDANGEFSIPVKAFVSSCGREGHETPLGTFKTSNYYQWRLMVDGTMLFVLIKELCFTRYRTIPAMPGIWSGNSLTCSGRMPLLAVCV